MTNNKDLEADQLIEWFRASTSYINAHQNKTFVILLSGEALAHENLPNIIYDLGLLHSLGIKLVLVHGARPQISKALQEAGKESGYHRNLRITEAECLDTIKRVVGGLSLDLESMFSLGTRNTPLHGADIRCCRGNFVTAKPIGVHDGIDFGFTGAVRKIKADAIQQLLDTGNLVLLSNLGYSLTGEVFNLSAEEIATEAAIVLGAEKLILFIPEAGVEDKKGNLITALSELDAKSHAERLLDSNSEDAQCVGHALHAALKAYEHNIHRSHLISFKRNGALLQELFTRTGNGSLLSADSSEQLRNATIEDVAGIMSLIKPLEEDGTLVQRSRELLETEVEFFQVIELEDTIIACAALYPITAEVGEIACIAIHPQYQGNGYGQRLLEALIETAQGKKLNKLIALSTVTTHWFLEHGFIEATLDALPEQRQTLYNSQRKSKVLIKDL